MYELAAACYGGNDSGAPRIVHQRPHSGGDTVNLAFCQANGPRLGKIKTLDNVHALHQ
jgi:hypothetical protein